MSAIRPVPRLEVSSRDRIVGDSPALRRAVALAERVAPTGVSVLLKGATGTGKELFARLIHERSHRLGRFVPVNCGALPSGMVESLLFGHRRGAFTDARETVVGFIEASHEGTLYLDELESLPPGGQVTLLRALESQEIYRVGDTDPRSVDLRVVGSVHEGLPALVAAGALRRDLCERLAGLVITLPPLCERDDDACRLAHHFAQQRRRTLGPGVPDLLSAYAWPGNVRELRLVIERAVLLSDEAAIPRAVIAEAIELGASAVSDARVQATAIAAAARLKERQRLFTACEAHAWHAGRTAHFLGIARVTLYRRLKAMGCSLRAEKRLHIVSPIERNNGNQDGGIAMTQGSATLRDALQAQR